MSAGSACGFALGVRLLIEMRIFEGDRFVAADQALGVGFNLVP